MLVDKPDPQVLYYGKPWLIIGPPASGKSIIARTLLGARVELIEAKHLNSTGRAPLFLMEFDKGYLLEGEIDRLPYGLLKDLAEECKQGQPIIFTTQQCLDPQKRDLFNVMRIDAQYS